MLTRFEKVVAVTLLLIGAGWYVTGEIAAGSTFVVGAMIYARVSARNPAQ